MRGNVLRLTYYCGFLGTGVMALGTVVAAVVYRGKNGEAFSPLNHFISELGKFGVSDAAVFFNGCLIASGLLLVGFMVGLGRQLQSRTATVASVFGVVSALSCSAVGLVPVNRLYAHLGAAFTLFYTATFAVALFTVAMHVDHKKRVSKWLQIPGTIALVCLASMDTLPVLTEVANNPLFSLQDYPRPAVWPAAIVEWCVLTALLVWIVLVSANLARRPRWRKTDPRMVSN